MNDFLIKYNSLDNISKLLVIKFIDFLINEKNINDNSFSNYKKKILDVSTWSEKDIQIFEQNQESFKNWEIAQW